MINQVADFLIAVALIIAVIFIIWGGIMYMTAGADEAKATEAKSRIKNGIIGAAVVLAVGMILSTVTSILAGSLQ
jgi:TRAP-type C4-dicarboxylate transport system permease small subunit